MIPIIDYGKSQASIFEANHIAYMECLVSGEGVRLALVYIYSSLLARKLINPIGSLPKEQKVNLWESAKEFSAGRLDNEKCIQLSKALYCLEYFLNQ